MITWLASYPKSGNTWLRLVLEAYLYGSIDLNHVRVRLDDQPDYIWQRISHKPLHLLKQADAPYLRPAMLMHLIETSPAPRYVKTHSVYGVANGVPLIPAPLTERAVYVVRDPRDVACSLANHLGQPLDQVIEEMGQQHVMWKNHGLYHFLGSWGEHATCWPTAPFPVHVVRYEDMARSAYAVFKGVLQFLDIEVAAGRLADALDMTDFDTLQAQEQAGGFREAPPNGNVFFRKGVVGGWCDELSTAQADRIVELCADGMKLHGYLEDEIEAEPDELQARPQEEGRPDRGLEKQAHAC